MSLPSLLEHGFGNERMEIARKGAIAVQESQDMSWLPRKVIGGVGKIMVDHPGAFRTAEVLGQGALLYGAAAGTHAMMNKNSSVAATAADEALKGMSGKVKSFGSKLMEGNDKGTFLHGTGNLLHKYPEITTYTGTLAAGAAGAAAIHGLSKSSGEGLPSHPWRYAAYHGSYIAGADLLATSIYEKLKAKEPTFPDQSHGVTSNMTSFHKVAQDLQAAILQKAADLNDNPSVLPYLGVGAAVGGGAGELATRALIAHRAAQAESAIAHNKSVRALARDAKRTKWQEGSSRFADSAANSWKEIHTLNKPPSGNQPAHPIDPAHRRAIEDAHGQRRRLILQETKAGIRSLRAEERAAMHAIPTELSRSYRYGIPAAAAATGALLAMNAYQG